jgi:hypothetical protein
MFFPLCFCIGRLLAGRSNQCELEVFERETISGKLPVGGKVAHEKNNLIPGT